jgi:hypothetical protein
MATGLESVLVQRSVDVCGCFVIDGVIYEVPRKYVGQDIHVDVKNKAAYMNLHTSDLTKIPFDVYRISQDLGA